jgi:hypothetical protein
MFGNITFIDDLMPDVRKIEILRDNGILPGNIPVGDLRIMIPVTVHQDIIIHRMVKKQHTGCCQSIVFLLIRRQETYVKIGCPEINPVGLGRIDGMESLGNVLRLIRILQTRAQDDLLMGKIAAVLVINTMAGLNPVFAARHH